MKRILLLLLILPLILTSCRRDPFADFLMSSSLVDVGETVYFTNRSLDATGYDWDFGDGYFSSNVNATHSYDQPGIYTVQLTAYGKDGKADVALADIEVVSPLGDLEINVKDIDTNFGVGNVLVKLYPTLTDWDEETALYAQASTNEQGRVIFTDLPAGYYYIDASNDRFDNWDLRDEDVSYIEVQVARGAITEFTAYVEERSTAPANLLVQVVEYTDEYVVPNASVILYPTINDWENETNMIVEGFTDSNGEVLFTNLEPNRRYYVDVWEADHDNYALASEDAGWIETQVLEGGITNTFIAYVDYYAPEKKSTASRQELKKIRAQEKKSGAARIRKENKKETLKLRR